tara:strand:- start:1461 stop:1637 length:177 start_codon:yes stop_codon:yes gene_type:complete
MKTLVTIKRKFDNGEYHEEATIYLNTSFVKKLKKDAVKTNYDGSIEMKNGDNITIHND